MIPITHPSTEAQKFQKLVRDLVMEAGVHRPIQGRVRVDIELYPNRPQDWAKRSRKDPDNWADTVQCIDLDNARKVLYDALKGLAFEDDKWIKADGGMICDPDEHGARVVVTVAPIVREPVARGLFA